MILAVDAGNTRVKAMLAGPGGVVPLFAVETAHLVRDARAFHRRLEKSDFRRAHLDGAAMCSVVPSLDRRLEAAVRNAAGNAVLTVRHTARFPFRVRVANPGRLGTDRLCAAAGAMDGRRSSAIIVDIGSAMTVDLVSRGEFRGGLIMPGPGLGLWALGRYARRLPRIGVGALRASAPVRFDDTRPAMTLGALTAARGALLEGVRLVRRSCGGHPAVFVTGGGAPALSALLPASWRPEPYLVGKGLYRVWLARSAGRTPGWRSRQKRA